MKILHTGDWHVGKKLGRIDRLAEAQACLDEVVEVARANDVDLVVVAGDLFDRALPPYACLRLVLATLRRLSDGGAQVVAVAGNHDSGELFEVLAPYLRPHGIHLGYKPLPPEDGGVVRIPARDGTHEAQVALFPFLHEGQVVDFMAASEEWHKSYADRIRAINASYASYMAERAGAKTVELLVGHFMIEGAIPSGSERLLHIGDAFMASRRALPSDIAYAALGHIHLTQEAPGAPVPAHYCGSLMQLDFGERGQDKYVLLVEVLPGRPARVEHVPITAGRKLVRVEGTMDEIRALAPELGDAILDVRVRTDGPAPALADEVRHLLPNALYVQALYERSAAQPDQAHPEDLQGAYSRYHEQRYGAAPSEHLQQALGELVAEVGAELPAVTGRGQSGAGMRPLELTLKGFSSHLNETKICFEDRTLIAIVGPTGAGKSSILDALAFALYGKTPRVKAKTKSLICSRAPSAHVRLRFATDGKEYVVTRVIKRSGAGEHLLESLGGGERVTGEAAVGERVEELLGLDFHAFCSSVLLAQGRFAEFLESPPAKQMQILKGVFRVEQVDLLREAAKRRLDACAGDLRELDGRRAQIPADLDERAAAAEQELADASAYQELLEALLPKERSLIAERARAAEELERAAARVAELQELLRSLPNDEDLGAVVARAEGAQAARDSAAARLAAAVAEEEAAAAALKKLVDEHGGEADLRLAVQSCRRLKEQTEIAAGAERELAEAKKTLTAAEQALERAQKRLRAAEEAENETLSALDEARAEHAAHELRGALKPGQPCPVCDQIVSVLPKSARPKALRVLEEKLANARGAVEQARREAGAAEAARAAAAVHLEAAERRLQEANDALATTQNELGAYAALDDPLAVLEERLAALTVATRRAETARAALGDLRAEHDKAARLLAEADEERRRLAGRLIAAAGALRIEPPEVDAGAEELRAAVVSLRAAAATALEEARDVCARAQGAGERCLEDLAVLRAQAGLEPDEAIDQAQAEARAAVATARAHLEQASAFKEQRAQLERLRAELDAELAVWRQLADDLTDRHFIRFLLEDYRRLLTELGSEQLRLLTGRYRFDDDAGFNVIDELDADVKRDIDTLSGGELFLASLALALGLAEAVARHGGRLDCFFLDEGFGSLDPESLDLALSGIERIVGPGRLIGLVSHVPEMAARIEDQIVLDKGPDGMTVVIAGGNCDDSALVAALEGGGLL